MDARFKAIQERQVMMAEALYGTQAAKYNRTMAYYEKLRSFGMATRNFKGDTVVYVIFENNTFQTATFDLNTTDYNVAEVRVGETR